MKKGHKRKLQFVLWFYAEKEGTGERKRERSLARREAVDEMDLQLRDSVLDTDQTHCAQSYESEWQSFISVHSPS
jgi:hypothetical protein